MNPLAEQLREIVHACVDEHGMQVPLHLIACSVNGSIFGIRTDGERPLVVVDHTEDGAFVLPINIMVSDARGQAARITICGDGGMRFDS